MIYPIKEKDLKFMENQSSERKKIIITSTPNGIENGEFYKLWMQQHTININGIEQEIRIPDYQMDLLKAMEQHTQGKSIYIQYGRASGKSMARKLYAEYLEYVKFHRWHIFFKKNRKKSKGKYKYAGK